MKRIKYILSQLGAFFMVLARVIFKALLAFFKTVFHLVKSFWGLRKKIFAPKNLFHYDNLFAVLTLLAFFGLFSKVNLEVINPIGEAFEDVEMTDLSYSVWQKNSDIRVGDLDGKVKLNKDITIINIGKVQRYDMEELLAYVNSFGPKVVAFDIDFQGDKGLIDNLLVEEMKRTSNLVLMSTLKGMSGDEEMLDLEERNKFDSVIVSHPKFSSLATNAFANMIINKDQSGGLTVTRDFLTKAINRNTGDTLYPWAVEIVKKYKPEVLKDFYKRDNFSETINYIGNIFVRNGMLPNDYDMEKKWAKAHFEAIEYRTIQEAIRPNSNLALDSSLFKDRIVLFGYLGDRIDVEEAGEDLFYTPLNNKYVGKTRLDMYGVVVHANIIATILSGDYVDEANDTFMHLVGFLLTYLVFAAYRPIYDDHKIWYDGLTKFVGIVFSLIIAGVIGTIFDWFNYKVVFGAIWFASILLAGDWLEIYYGLFKNFFSRVRDQMLSK